MNKGSPDRNYTTSTGVRKELEITVPVYETLFSSPTKEESGWFSEIEIFGEYDEYTSYKEESTFQEAFPMYLSEMSTGDTLKDLTESDLELIAPSVPKFFKPSSEQEESNELADTIVQTNADEMKIDSSQSSFPEVISNAQQSFRENSLLDFDVPSFFEKFGLKEENIRQTVVRRFKFCMKKISQDLNRYKNFSNAKYLKLIFRIMKLYFLDIKDRDFAENIYLEIRNLIDRLDPDSFRAFYSHESSCNSTYVKDLFHNSIMRKLYRLHHSLGSQGEIYFKKFKQFQDRNLDQGDRQQVIMYCDQFLDIYA